VLKVLLFTYNKKYRHGEILSGAEGAYTHIHLGVSTAVGSCGGFLSEDSRFLPVIHEANVKDNYRRAVQQCTHLRLPHARSREEMEWNQWLICVILYGSFIVYKGVEGEG